MSIDSIFLGQYDQCVVEEGVENENLRGYNHKNIQSSIDFTVKYFLFQIFRKNILNLFRVSCINGR